jgi:small subunit ribosomal protein S6
MRIYEELFIVKPDTPEEDRNGLVDQMTQLITTNAGTVEKVEHWGVRKLAYRVGKQNDGFYVLVQFTAPPTVVKEIERRLRVADPVLKFITVRIDEKLKRIEKRKQRREKRAQRKPAPQMTTPGDPLAEQMLARAAEGEERE